jgi:taurine dioxygenase
MDYETITVKPLTPVIGAEISDVDISKPLGNQTFAEVHDALMRHQVIFFRDQDMSLDEQKAFGRHFGELHIHPAAPSPEGHPEILQIHADENSKRVAGHGWHTDVSCDAEPPMGSILYLRKTPEVGGDTMFSSMYAAYEALSPSMQTFLEGLSAEHASEHVYRNRYDEKSGQKTLRDGEYPRNEHPVIRTHPVTRRKALYVNSGFTRRIVGLERKESEALLEFLFDHVRTPEFHVRFAWEDNSVAFWDNRCVQHHALWDYYPQVRSGSRVTVKGDAPFYSADENPGSTSSTEIRMSGYGLKSRP